MCGIAFVINYGKAKMDTEFLNSLFDLLSLRGTDSSGYYFERVEGEKTVKRMIKAPIPSTDLIEASGKWKDDNELFPYKLNGKEKIILFHCRQRTRGSEYNNLNNMPIASKNHILIHNGVITSSKIKDYPYTADVDSEEILARVETMGILKGISDVSGSMAIAVKPIKRPYLYIYRNTNPLDIVMYQGKNILIGCSNQSYVGSEDNEGENILEILLKQDKKSIEVPSHFLYCLYINKKAMKPIAKINHNKDN